MKAGPTSTSTPHYEAFTSFATRHGATSCFQLARDLWDSPLLSVFGRPTLGSYGLPGGSLARIPAGRLRAGSSRAASRYVEYKGVLGRAVAPRQPRREGPLRALWRHLQVEVHFSALLLTT